MQKAKNTQIDERIKKRVAALREKMRLDSTKKMKNKAAIMKKGFTHESMYNETKEWFTPKRIFDALRLEFDLDPCSPGADIVPWIPAKRHLTYMDNGLIAHWEGRVWLNPPYGGDTPKWLQHLSMVGNGIALVFARTDTLWFHDYAVLADAMCFVKGRIQFVKAAQAQDYANGVQIPLGTPGAGSLLLAWGDSCASAVLGCGLGWCVDNRQAGHQKCDGSSTAQSELDRLREKKIINSRIVVTRLSDIKLKKPE